MISINRNKTMKKIAALYLLFGITLTSVLGKVKPNSLFTDHMVLQKGIPIKIWGTADAGEQITVSFNGQKVSTVCQNGKWMAILKPLPYILKPQKMMIAGSDTVFINDIVVGEVWLCSGQSNMERQLGLRPPQPPITNWQQERDDANYSAIREFYVPLKYANALQADVNSQWTVCSPQTVTNFSAVGYFFARQLYQKLHVPIGILFSAYGGTPAEDWVSNAALGQSPNLVDIITHNKDQELLYNYKPKNRVLSGLFNGMIYPLIPYGIKGVAWYQGEANNPRAKQYQEVLTTLINNWRQDFGEGDFPFLIVQIAPYKDINPELRESQLRVAQYVKNTALIVTTDCGLANQIHPPNKQPVGIRLSLAARALAYHEHITYQGPFYRGFKVKNHQIVLSFTNTNGGLQAKGDTLRGFSIAGADKIFIPAKATIKGRKVMVFNPNLPNARYVRYGWANVPDVNLFNGKGLPASPFRTDND